MIRRWFWRRRVDAQASVLLAIQSGHRYGLDIQKAAGIRAGRLYPVLDDLLDRGLVRSEWANEPDQHRRRRAYYLA